ncbi:uncharacterized protein LOC135468728 [Liolophura sinensis]|uniref:uncharacterized protein LOC135468728 n=1 Tax=Liolophura sinensis TaxID=3198878 RepID=UPI00315845CE
MRLEGPWCLGLALIIITEIGVTSAGCDDNAIHRCLQPLSRYKLGMRSFDVTKLKHACSVFPDVKRCISGAGNLDSCESGAYLQWIRIEAALQFGCGKGYRDLEIVAPCMQRQVVKRQIAECKFEFNRDFCRSVVKFIQCMGYTARRYCGDRAGNVTLVLANRVAKATAIATGLTCTDDQHTGSIRLAIGLTISVLLVLIAIVGIIVWAKRKHVNRKQQSLLHNDFLQMQGDGKD